MGLCTPSYLIIKHVVTESLVASVLDQNILAMSIRAVDFVMETVGIAIHFQTILSFHLLGWWVNGYC